MKISIPELESRGLSLEDMLKLSITMLEDDVDALSSVYQEGVITDIDGYSLTILRRICKISDTLLCVIVNCEDYTVANSIIRMLADAISSYYLVYFELDERTLVLRHYLYIIDGLCNRLRIFPERLEYDGKITRQEFVQLSAQIERAKINYNDAIDVASNNILKSAETEEERIQYQRLIKTHSWRFKSVGKPNPREGYSWKELYELLKDGNMPKYISSLSDFVHGLSSSNLFINMGEDTFSQVFGIASAFLGNLHQKLQEKYKEHSDLMKKRILFSLEQNKYPDAFVSHIVKSLIFLGESGTSRKMDY